VASKATPLDAAFIDKQRHSLLKLREDLLDAAKEDEIAESAVNAENTAGPREYEDDAQRLTALELDGTLVAHDVARLGQIERALQKIKQGTYGISDVSGQPIPRERLEAVPEATDTVTEEQTLEKTR
jgi:DnaK suppressor protein